MTGDARTDRGLIALTSLIAEIAATAKPPIPEPIDEAAEAESLRHEGKQQHALGE